MNANKHEFGKIQEKANHQVHGRTKRPLITSLTRTFNFFAHKQFPIQIRATPEDAATQTPLYGFCTANNQIRAKARRISSSRLQISGVCGDQW
jgi:hypothetical protein